MSFTGRLALLYAGLFGSIGVQLPFLPMWLAAKGLDERSIGMVLAIATAARVVMVPFGTRAADRFGNLKAAIVIAAGLCAVGLTTLGFSGSLASIALCLTLAACASGVALPVTEAYALRGLNARGRAYGPVRLWGSAAFIAGAMATGLLLDWIAAVHLIWILVGSYWLTVIAAALLHPVDLPAAPVGRGAGGSASQLLRQPALLAVIVASGCVQASHALFYAFGTLQWSAAGLNGASIAALWSLSVLAEIVLFALSSRFPPWLGPAALLGIGAAGAALRWGAMALDPGLALLPALQCLHALSFGATHLGAVQFVARAAPPQLAATAQGMLATANGMLMAAAMAASGMLNAGLGVAGYAAMVLLALAGGGAAALAWRSAR